MLGTAVVVLVLAAAGCGGGGADEADASATTVEPSTTSEPTSPPTTTLTEEQQVLAAYQGYWDTWLLANDPPNPDHPDLERYYTGRSLERARQEIAERRSVGQVIQLAPSSRYRHEAVVVSIDGDVATVTDCSVDDSQVVDRASGRVLNDAVVTETIEASMVRSGGAWKVQLTNRTEMWEGESGCIA